MRECVRLTVAYDGTDFHGFAISAAQRTVMGELTAAVATRRAHPGRTHGRRPHRRRRPRVGPGRLRPAPRTTPTCVDCNAASTGCAAPRSPSARWSGPTPSSPLGSRRRRAATTTTSGTTRIRTRWLARTSWHVPDPLDLDAMNEAAGALLGEHDFSSFCRRPRPRRESRPSRHDGGMERRRHASRSDHTVRDRRLVVLSPDGAQHRRHARRRRPRSSFDDRHGGDARCARSCGGRPGRTAPRTGAVGRGLPRDALERLNVVGQDDARHHRQRLLGRHRR